MYDDSGICLDEMAVVWDFGDQSCRDLSVKALLRSVMLDTLARTFVPDGVQESSIYISHDGPAMYPSRDTEIACCLPPPALRSL